MNKDNFNYKLKNEIINYLLETKISCEILAFFYFQKYLKPQETVKSLKLKKSNIEHLNMFINEYLISNEITFENNEKFFVFKEKQIEKFSNIRSANDIKSISFHSTKNLRFILSSIFVLSGYINDPQSKYYHFEVRVIKSNRHFILDAFKALSIVPKERIQAGMYNFYIKKAAQIADLLKAMGAFQAVLLFEDTRIERDFFSQYHKVQSMDSYNLIKISEASNDQIQSINSLMEKIEFKELSKNLQNLAYLRLEMPNLSIGELTFEYNKKYNEDFSKSTIYHWLRKFKKLG